MNIYVVSTVWDREGSTVIGAGATRADAEAIADRMDGRPELRGRWSPWTERVDPTEGSCTWVRVALQDDGTISAARMSQEIVCVPLAGYIGDWPQLNPIDETGPALRWAAPALVAGVEMRDWPIYRDPLPQSQPTAEALSMDTVMTGWRELIDRTIRAQFADPLRCGSGEAWRWVERQLDAMLVEHGKHPGSEALPDSVAARFAGIDIVLDPDLPPNVMRIGPKIYVVDGEKVYGTDEKHWPAPYFTSPPGSGPAAD